MTRTTLLLTTLATVALWAVSPSAAAAHRDGGWMLEAEVQLRVEDRGYQLATCRGRGPLRLPVPVPDPQYALFRHFECFVNLPGSRVLCVHTRVGKRLVLALRPQAQDRCRVSTTRGRLSVVTSPTRA